MNVAGRCPECAGREHPRCRWWETRPLLGGYEAVLMPDGVKGRGATEDEAKGAAWRAAEAAS